MVDVAIKFFRRIGIAGDHSGNFIHLDVDPSKTQDVIWTYWGYGKPLSLEGEKGSKTTHDKEETTLVLSPPNNKEDLQLLRQKNT